MPAIYFGLCPNKQDIKAIQLAKPKCILLSYAYWRRHRLVNLIDQLGYRPTIMIDSGAFTFLNKNIQTHFWELMELYAYEYKLDPGLVINDIRYHQAYDDNDFEHPADHSLFLTYLDWLDQNRNYYDHVISFDSIGDPELTTYAFEVMQSQKHSLLAVFHYGADFAYLDRLVEAGAEYIALGAMATTKIKISQKVSFVLECVCRYPEMKFHFLGSLDMDLIKKIPNITSIDGSSWLPTFNDRIAPGKTKLTQSILNIQYKEQAVHQLPNLLF